MLELVVGETEHFDETTNKFVKLGGITLELEHSLVALSKWESKFEKPFLSRDAEKTPEEVAYYIECMVVSGDAPENLLSHLSQENIRAINEYIEMRMSATWFNENGPQKGSSEAVTSELIYYWMLTFQIPTECQYWHLNRLFNLIRICSIKQQKPQKMNTQDRAQQQRALNAKRRQELGSKG